MADLINLINNNVIEWRIAAHCGILFVMLIVLLALAAQLRESHIKSKSSPEQSTAEEAIEKKLAKLSPNNHTLKEKIAQKQTKLSELESSLHQIEGIARESEDDLTDLYRQISDLKGEIESDKSKLRLRGDSSLTGR